MPFVHYVIDFSLREIVTARDEKVTLCEIVSNAPLEAEYIEASEGFFRWDKVIEAGKPFEFQSGCFCFILIKKCCGDIGLFAIAHPIPDDPTFQSLVYEGDELLTAASSDVSIGLLASFAFAWFNAGQRLRIETIPDLATHDKYRKPLWKKRKPKQEDNEE